MTCKDCIGYVNEICDGYTPTDLDKDVWHYCSEGRTDQIPDIEKRCGSFKNKADVVLIPESGIGDLSDGYHTFNELYHHRAILFSVICNIFADRAWKSKLHDTGDMYDGMFIVGIETPDGQATYHYDISPYWDMFKVKELEKAPKWDGHTPEEAINRIAGMSATDKTRRDKFKKMSVEELAEAIVTDGDYYGDKYCKSDCGSDDDCPHPVECCKKWLMEEIEE